MRQLFKFGPTRQIIFANTSYQIIGKTVSVFSTLIISFYLARFWGASGFGDFSKITTFVSLFYLLVDFGLNAIYLQKSWVSGAAWWLTFVRLRVFLTLGLFFLALLISFLLPGSLTQGYTSVVHLGIIVFAPTILFQSVVTTLNAIFQKSLNYRASAIAVAVGSLAGVVVMFFSLLFFPALGIFSGVVALFFGSLFTALSSWYLARPLLPQIPSSPPSLPYKEFFFLSAPLGVTLLINLLYVRLDSIILTLTRPTPEVGVYALAYKVFEVALVLPTFFMNAVYPLLLKRVNSTSKSTATHEFWLLFSKSAVFLLALSFIVLIFSFLVSPYLKLIHSEFAASVSAFRVLSLSFPAFFLTSLFMWAAIALSAHRSLLIIYFLGLLVNLLLNLIFTPSLGYQAAAWITVGSEALIFVVLGLLLLKIYFWKREHV